MQIDPICGMQVDENTAQYKTEYKGKTYYFCAPDARKPLNPNLRNTSRVQAWARKNPGGNSGNSSSYE